MAVARRAAPNRAVVLRPHRRRGVGVVTPEDRSAGAPPPPRVPRWLAAELPGGAAGRRVCAFCGEEAPPDSAFCPRDGRALSAALVPEGDRSLTVLFTDIEDSVRLNERLGDAQWAHVVDEHNWIVRAAIDQHAGFEVKMTGDGFLVVFAEAVHAARCAVAIQRRIESRRLLRADWPVRVRIGTHSGDVILRAGGDILGRTVNIAERILGRSAGGEIWASEQVVQAVGEGIPAEQWIDRGVRRLKGVAAPLRLYELRWREDLPTPAPPPPGVEAVPSPAS